jgi:hypothetical protein
MEHIVQMIAAILKQTWDKTFVKPICWTCFILSIANMKIKYYSIDWWQSPQIELLNPKLQLYNTQFLWSAVTYGLVARGSTFASDGEWTYCCMWGKQSSHNCAQATEQIPQVCHTRWSSSNPV